MILVAADLQLDDNPRNSYRHRFMRWLVKQVQAIEPQYLLLLGDLTEEKDHHSAWLVRRIVHYLAQYSETCEVIVLRGNHDYEDINEPFFQFTSHLDGVRFISDPKALELKGYGKCLFLPHTRDYKRDWKALPANNPQWIFAHNTFEGAVGVGARPLEGVPQKALPGDCAVLSGDVHVPQKYGRVISVGAPYRVDYGDDYKGRLLKVERGGRVVSMPYTGPQKTQLSINSVDELDGVEIAESEIVKVRMEMRASDAPKWGDYRKQIEQWASKQKVVLDAVIPRFDRTPGERVEVEEKGARKSDKRVVKEFARYRDVDDKTLQVGLTLMDDE